MIFPTLKERTRVYTKIARRENFEDLTEMQRDFIEGMYLSIRELEALKEDDDIYDEDIAIIDECIGRIELRIAEVYVSYVDVNAMNS